LRAGTRTLLAVGKIIKAFGIKGEIVLRPMSDSPRRFARLKKVYVGAGDSAVTEHTVERAAAETKGVRLKFAGVNDRNGAEKLTGLLVFVDENNAVRPPKGRYFIHDVVGLEVVDEHGKNLGVVSDVFKHPAHDVYVIAKNGREFMVPAVQEFVQKIDLRRHQMKVRLIEGMREEDAR
jgi:16S rRNA processing protein RimM